MKTIADVLDSVWGLLSAPTPGTGKTFTRFYRWSYPDDCQDSYFGVINALSVPTDPIQTVDVNVNVYAKDINVQRGIPDLTALNAMATSVISDMHHKNNDVYDISYQFMNVIREEVLNAHLFNLRFKLIFINN